jgi:hypothetical protein
MSVKSNGTLQISYDFRFNVNLYLGPRSNDREENHVFRGIKSRPHTCGGSFKEIEHSRLS